MKFFVILLVFVQISAITDNKPLFIDTTKQIVITEQRIKNIKEYTRIRYGKEQVQINPKIIVIHSTESRAGIGAVDRICSYFASDSLRGWIFQRWNYIRHYGRLNVGTQFIIDRDGTIYRLMPDLLIGRHCIGLDWCSIGIENIGYNDLTDEQLRANVKLVEYLKAKYPGIEYLIGHYEYRKFEGTELWKEKSNMRTKKVDPGEEFIERLKFELEVKNITFRGI